MTFAPNAYPRNELPFGELLEKACPEPVRVDLGLAPSGLPVRIDVSANYLRSNEAVSTTSTTESSRPRKPRAGIGVMPVFASLLVAVHASTFHSIWPVDLRMHRRHRTLEVAGI